MRQTAFICRAAEGPGLFTQCWEPETIPAGVVCVVHGLGEHSGRYAHVAEFLHRFNLATLAIDLRGHGRSPGYRGHVASYELLMGDLGCLLEEAARRYAGARRFLFGHSLGGNLVLNYVLRCRPQLAGVAVTAPALRLAFKPPAWKLAWAHLVCRIWPTWSTTNELEVAGLSRDPAVLKAYREDPLVHNRISARLAIELLRAGQWALEHAAEFSVPLLLMHGNADRLTSVDASHEFAAKAGHRYTVVFWDGFYHELHNDQGKEKVLTVLGDWFHSRLADGE